MTTGIVGIEMVAGTATTAAAAATTPAAVDGCEVELRLLGGFELRVDDEVIELQPALQRLLAFVALTPRGVERSCAAYQLWPDKNEDRAKANLRSTLWRLNKLSADPLRVTKTRLSLAARVWVDARDGIEALRGASDADEFDGVLPFHVLASELLPDWYDEWLVVEREQLRQLSLCALEARGRRSLAQGLTADAIHVGLSAIALDPLRESSHRLVIEAHLRDGNESEARRQLAHYRVALACDPALHVSDQMAELFTRDLPVAV